MPVNPEPAAEQPRFLNEVNEWLSVAESQYCALEVLCHQVPILNSMLEENMVQLSNNFSQLAAELAQHQKGLESLAQTNDNAGELQESAAKMMDCVKQAIIAMQFQDRVSQNLVIIQNISHALQKYMHDRITTSLEKTGVSRKKVLDKELATQLLGLFTLGELKKMFINFLMEEGYINNAEELGMVEEEGAADHEDDIELF